MANYNVIQTLTEIINSLYQPASTWQDSSQQLTTLEIYNSLQETFPVETNMLTGCNYSLADIFTICKAKFKSESMNRQILWLIK